MKKYPTVLVAIGCLAAVGCDMQQPFTKTQIQADMETCAYGVAVPHDYDTPKKRAHFIK